MISQHEHRELRGCVEKTDSKRLYLVYCQVVMSTMASNLIEGRIYRTQMSRNALEIGLCYLGSQIKVLYA